MKGIYLIAILSLLALGCSTQRRAHTSAQASAAESAQTTLSLQAVQQTAQVVETHGDSEMATTVTIDEYDTTQPRDPAAAFPPLKRREVRTTTWRARQSATARTDTSRRDSVAVESKAEGQAEAAEETSIDAAPAKSGWWGWFRAGMVVAFVLVVVVFAFKNKVKNLLKPF